MTYKELYLKEHPECEDFDREVVMHLCPKDNDGFDISCPLGGMGCTQCWYQEIPELCSSFDSDSKRCNGTKERDECSCGGDETKCDFYPEKRTKAAEKSDIQKAVEKLQSCGFKEAGEAASEATEAWERLLEKQGGLFKDAADARMRLDKENLEEIDNDILKGMIKSAEEETSSIEDSIPVYSECPHYDERTETCRDHMDHERCVCGGDMTICDFFSEKRERAKKMVDSISEAINNGPVVKNIDVKHEVDFTGVTVEPTKTGMAIKDSGTRREFSTGAVRDIQEGKGRCDLMPLDIVAAYLENSGLGDIAEFERTGNVTHLYDALVSFTAYPDDATMLLEVAKHFEAGAAKYGEWNWQKGIPTHCYIDSAVRHYLKYLRGDADESHDRAFVWNILCCIWTCKHKPELNDYPRKEKTDE